MIYLNSIIGKGEVALSLKIVMIGLSIVAIFVCLGFILFSLSGILTSLKVVSERPTAMFAVIFYIAILAASSAMSAWCVSNIVNYSSKEVSRNASLTEVSNLISVNGDKVEIKPFEGDYSKYFYYRQSDGESGYYLEEDQTQIFKIEEDTFYNRMYLIDKNNQKSELSEDEKNMIKSKRNH